MAGDVSPVAMFKYKLQLTPDGQDDDDSVMM